MRGRLTVSQVFSLFLVVLGIALATFFIVLFSQSMDLLIEGSKKERAAVAERVASQVRDFLATATSTMDALELQIRAGTCSASSPEALEPCMFSLALEHSGIAELALTHGKRVGLDPQSHESLLAPGDRWQASVFQPAPPQTGLCARTTRLAGEAFAQLSRCVPSGAALPEAKASPPQDVKDPTQLDTFKVAASERFYRRTIYSDLAWSDLDQLLPKSSDRRVVFDVLRTIEDTRGDFVGVARVSLLAEQINDRIRKITEGSHQLFICDSDGRLITRLSPADPIEVIDDDLRVVPTTMPPEVKEALERVKGGNEHEEIKIGGNTYLASFRKLENTQDWVVGVVVPEMYYLPELRRTLGKWALASALFLLVLVAAGWVTARTLRLELARIEEHARTMRDFDFSPRPRGSAFRDVASVLDGLEHAKTALRALGKYVPVALVRQLYHENREPTLGGELRELTIMFTDIRDFTSWSETLRPERLAVLLGRYLEVMTAAVHAHGAIVDKYVGDSVMALWNSPRSDPEHAIHGCKAALACLAATDALFRSPEWAGNPVLLTRIGLHTDEVMVGHFGAPDRMSYTALGDGVNLASRLEALNKEYGTRILVSGAVFQRAKALFTFRRIDRVAVKGKARETQIYELLGAVGAVDSERLALAQRYEAALTAYWARDFAGAISLLERAQGDPPSQCLLDRCREAQRHPPGPDWDGIRHLQTK